MSILDAEVTQKLDEAGTFRVRLPLTDPRTAEAQVGRIWRHYREGEGLVFAGLIEDARKQPEDTLEISGPTILAELLYKNTLLNRQYSSVALNTVIDGLLTVAGGGWARLGSDTTTISARFDGESILKAILVSLGQVGRHLRETVTESGGVLTKKAEIGVFGVASGVTLMGGQPDEPLFDDAHLAAVDTLEVEDTLTEVWNWVIPLGGGTGMDQLTLRWSTRTTPYTIHSMTGPDGKLLYYISDGASITAYGQRERPFVAKDIQPLSNTKPALIVAANALYDLAATQLYKWWRDKQTAYKVTVRGLDPAVRPGDTVRLRWRGYALQQGTGYVYLDINTDLYVLARTRRFAQDGTEASELVVSNLDRALQSSDDILIGKLEDTARVFRTHVQTSVSNYTSGPVLEDLDATYPLGFDLLIDDNVTQLLRCRLRLKPKAIRSTVQDTASGLSVTQNESHTHAQGNMTGATSIVGHTHGIGNLGSTFGWVNPSKRRGLELHTAYGDLWLEAGWDTGYEGNAAVSSESTNCQYGPGTLAISLSGSHSHNITPHTHTQVYGIYEGGTATNLTVKIDGTSRTVALGGPWNVPALLDITQYLQDADGVVVPGIHTIELGSSTVGRVEVWVDWTVVVQAIIAT